MLTVHISETLIRQRQLRQQQRFTDVQAWEKQLSGMVSSSSRITQPPLLAWLGMMLLYVIPE